MITAKLTSKGQITVPKKIREKLGVTFGEEIQFKEDHGVFIIKKGVRKSPFDRWVGCLKGKGGKTDPIIENLRGQ